jgi:hypothetical protein
MKIQLILVVKRFKAHTVVECFTARIVGSYLALDRGVCVNFLVIVVGLSLSGSVSHFDLCKM